MAIQIKNTYSGRTDNTDTNYPYGKGRNVVGGVEGTGTPFEAQWYNNLEGFLQGLLLEAGITPDGKVDNANSSQLVEAVKGIAQSVLVGKIFKSPTDDGLTEIQTRTVEGGEVYEVRKTSDDSLATIYRNAAGTTEIVQNGTANVSNSDGVVEFYIADGSYYVEVDSVKGGLVVSKLKPFLTVADMKAYDLSGFTEGTRIEWQGYYEQSDGGGNSGLLKFGAHTADDGSIFSIDGNTYIKADITHPLNPLKFGLSVNNTPSENTESFNACLKALSSFSNIFASAGAGTVKVPPALLGSGAVSAYSFDTSVNDIEIDSGVEIYGDKTTILRLSSGLRLFTAKDRLTKPNYHITIRDLTIDKHPSLDIAGTVGLDLLHCSYTRLGNLRIRTFEKGINAGGIDGDGVNGGYYNNFTNLEVANCDWAIYTEFEFNSNKIIGGRYLSNKVGLVLDGCSDNYISTAFEKTNLGIQVKARASSNTMAQCRFESTGRGQGGGGALDYVTGGAIRFEEGSSFNTVVGGHYSGQGDVIIDNGTANTQTGAVRSGGGCPNNSTMNLFGNSVLDVDSNGDGLADGLSQTPTVGITNTIDLINNRTGGASQRITIDPSNTIRRDTALSFAVEDDVTYTVNILAKTDTYAGWNIRIGLGTTSTEFSNIPILTTFSGGDGFKLYSVTFKADAATLAGQKYVFVSFFMASGTVGTNANLWIDNISIVEGHGGVQARNNIVPNHATLEYLTTNAGRLSGGHMSYVPEIGRLGFIDSDGSVRNAAGRKVVGSENNVDAAPTTTLPAGRNVVIINSPGAVTIVDNIAADDDAVVTLIVPSSDVTITDGGNKRLNGDFIGGSNGTIQLACIGVVWYEVGRSQN